MMTESTVKITIKARNLLNASGREENFFDTFAVATVLPSDDETNPIILGKTEV